jgi:hypothetical protein
VKVKSSRASLGRGLVAATSPKKKQLIKDIFGSDDEQEEPKAVVLPHVKDEKQSQEGEVGCSQHKITFSEVREMLNLLVLWIQSRCFWASWRLDPDPLVRGMDPDPAPDTSIIKQK